MFDRLVDLGFGAQLKASDATRLSVCPRTPWSHLTHGVVWAVACLVLACGLLPVSATHAQNDAADKADAVTVSQISAWDTLFDYLTDDRYDLTRRRKMAVILLNESAAEVDTRLMKLLNDSDELALRRAIAQGIATATAVPSDKFVPTLAALLDKVSDPLLEDVAAALGRFVSHPIADELRTKALNEQVETDLRIRAMRVLVYHHNKAAAGTLVQLIEPGQNAQVRDAAFDALGLLTGVTENQRQSVRWQRWWNEYKHLPDEQWYARIINNVELRNQRLAAQSRAILVRLVETQRALYLTMSDAERLQALEDMLEDSQPVIQLLALDLTIARRVAGKQIGPELRQQVIEQLKDDTPTVRAKAASILLALADENGAAAVAALLKADSETDVTVLKSFLALLAKMPQAEAIESILAFLPSTALRSDAAGALAAAAEKNLLETVQKQRVAVQVRQQLRDDKPPAPQVVTLLSRVGNGEDWLRIKTWLAGENEAVKVAAARAWADSTQPLAALAARAGDPVVRPFFIAAAGKRGKDEATLTVLVASEPPADQTQPHAAWREALVAMARQTDLPPAAVLTAESSLATRKASPQLRNQVLTAVIDRVMTALAANPQSPLGTALPDLLLARAEAKLDGEDAKGAKTDLTRLAPTPESPLTPVQARRRSVGLVRVELVDGKLDEALAASERLLEQGRNEAAVNALAAAFLNAADASIEDKQTARAEQTLDGLTTLLGATIPESIAQQIREARARLRAAAGEAKTSTDSNS